MTRHGKHSEAVVAALVLVAACLPLLPVLSNGFTNWDDPDYITANPRVLGGLTADGILWAWTTTAASNWHPLTWMSHQLDATLFGAEPRGHHGVSLALHAASAVLLFLAFSRATGCVGASAATAVLFAIHPLRVESVAWASERKDVLATFFWALGMLSWVRWVERPSARRYGAVATSLLLGLLAKPMLVSFPFALLLLDGWPLGRWKRPRLVPPWALIREKLPLVALAAASVVVTLVVQRGAMPGEASYPLSERAPVAIVAYAVYLSKTLVPTGLSPFYPHPGPTLEIWKVVASAGAIAALTWTSFRFRERAPWAWFGWLWYVGTLLPVIGLVQVGSHAWADRYTYIPSIGIAVALVWSFGDALTAMRPSPRTSFVAASALGGALALGLGATTWTQATHWRDSTSLFRHALAVEPDNPLAHNNLGLALLETGETEEAIRHFREASNLAPAYADARGNLALALGASGDASGAESAWRAYLRERPGDPTALESLGRLLVDGSRAMEAIAVLQEATRSAPGRATSWFWLARALAAEGRGAEAVASAERAEALGYREADLYALLGWELIRAERFQEARRALETLVRLRPDYAPARANLAAVKERLGRIEEPRAPEPEGR